jgi:hypothetical protein
MGLAEKLKNQGLVIDSDLVYSASMWHDIAKHRCLQSGQNHCQEGERILRAEGHQEIDLIVRQHCLEQILEKDGFVSLEAKVVYYADKRVNHNKTVSLAKRFDYLKNRYPKSLANILKCEPLVYQLEKELLGN